LKNNDKIISFTSFYPKTIDICYNVISMLSIVTIRRELAAVAASGTSRKGRPTLSTTLREEL
jgi:hypothetical protein